MPYIKRTPLQNISSSLNPSSNPGIHVPAFTAYSSCNCCKPATYIAYTQRYTGAADVRTPHSDAVLVHTSNSHAGTRVCFSNAPLPPEPAAPPSPHPAPARPVARPALRVLVDAAHATVHRGTSSIVSHRRSRIAQSRDSCEE